MKRSLIFICNLLNPNPRNAILIYAISLLTLLGRVAQLDRALDSGSRCRGFDSLRARYDSCFLLSGLARFAEFGSLFTQFEQV